MRALTQLVAARSGQLLVPGTLGNELKLSRQTVNRYLGLLEEVFLIKRVPAWSRNVGSRAVSTPKGVFVDSGVAANLLDLDATSLRQPGGQLGPLLEGFVMMEIARQLTWSQQSAELYHYRTKDKVEIDIVLENRRGQVVAIEVKASTTVRGEDFSGIRHLADRIGDDLIVGLVLYTGPQTLPFGLAPGFEPCLSVRYGRPPHGDTRMVEPPTAINLVVAVLPVDGSLHQEGYSKPNIKIIWRLADLRGRVAGMGF